MDNATRRMLNDGEQAIIRLIESKGFAKLDEDGLLELHGRTRRARNKYSKLVRRRGAAKVGKAGSRAVASKATVRTAAKAELFEGALATVSARLAKVASANAKALKDERIAAARAVKQKAAAKKAVKKKAAAKKRSSAAKRSLASPVSKRARAAKRASNQRKQAKRDKR